MLEKIQERQLGWLAHVSRMPDGTVFDARAQVYDKRGGPRKSYRQVVKETAQRRLFNVKRSGGHHKTRKSVKAKSTDRIVVKSSVFQSVEFMMLFH